MLLIWLIYIYIYTGGITYLFSPYHSRISLGHVSDSSNEFRYYFGCEYCVECYVSFSPH